MTAAALDFHTGAERARARRAVRRVPGVARRRAVVAELVLDPPPHVAQLPLSRVLLWATDSIAPYLAAAGSDRRIWALTHDQRQAVAAALRSGGSA